MTQRRLFTDRVTDEDVLFALSGTNGWLSRKEIAELLHVSKNSTLINLLEQMVADGFLKRRENVTINRQPIFEYKRAGDHD